MRTSFIFTLLLLSSFFAWSQDSSVVKPADFPLSNSFVRKTTMITVSFGFVDYNKQNYKLPDSTKYGSSSAALPFYFRLERAVGNNISIAASLGYDVFYYNYSRLGYTNGVPFYTANIDKLVIVSPGLELFYHFNKLIPVRHLDVYVGLGGTANYLKHSNYPKSDTLSTVTKPTIAPLVRLSARYYINRHASLFADIGYDQMSLFSLGVSFRFFDKKFVAQH